MKKILLLALIFVSCKTQKEIPSEEVERTYILIDDHYVEMVSDEFGNQYLRYLIEDKPIFIPFPFETESAEDSIHSFQAKIPTDDKRRI